MNERRNPGAIRALGDEPFRPDVDLLLAIEFKVPPHMRPGLIAYLENGRVPGDFLLRLLQGRLDAFLRADDINRERAVEWIEFLFHSMPAITFGTETVVAAFVEHQQRTTQTSSEEEI